MIGRNTSKITLKLAFSLLLMLSLCVCPVKARHHSNGNSDPNAASQSVPRTAPAQAQYGQDPSPSIQSGPGQAQSAPIQTIDTWHAPFVPPEAAPELNVRVANFAVENLGKQIGNGECWTLAKEALIYAHAQPPADYVFGRELQQNESWLPGDIIQFTNCHFEDIQPHRRTTFNLGSPNHTAIIHSLSNGLVVVLQQNVNNDRHVQTQTLNFSKMVSGSIRVYRPIPAFGDGRQSSQFNSSKSHSHHNNQSDNGNNFSNSSPAPKKKKGQKNEIHPTNTSASEVSSGIMYDERRDLMQRIRKLQSNGVNVYYYMQRFLDLDTKAHSVQASDAARTQEVSEEIGTLNQLLTIREAKLNESGNAGGEPGQAGAPGAQ